MKTAIFRFTLLAFLALSSAGHCETTNTFRIYLPSDSSAYRYILNGKVDLSHIQLAETPLISEADIISYDVSNHVVTLKPEALVRIQEVDVDLRGTPFVVVADGQRIYLGGFMNQVSSFALRYPTILVGLRWTPDPPMYSFTIIPELHAKPPQLPTNCLVIDRAYPSPSFGAGPDPRGDPRIKSALKALHKLRNDE